MDERKQSDEKPDHGRVTDRERRLSNLVLLLIFGVLVGIGIWLANAMIDARRADECITTGRRNCAPIEVPPR